MSKFFKLLIKSGVLAALLRRLAGGRSHKGYRHRGRGKRSSFASLLRKLS